MNINPAQREDFQKIIDDNGRAQEYYEKFGREKVAKNKTQANKLVGEIKTLKTLEEVITEKHDKEEKAMQKTHTAETDKVTGKLKTTESKLDKLGFSYGREWVNGEYVNTLQEDTSITQAEYEMFKKKAKVGIIGASSLEEANKIIKDYLSLVIGK